MKYGSYSKFGSYGYITNLLLGMNEKIDEEIQNATINYFNSGNIYNFSGQFLLLGTCVALHSCNIFFLVVKLPPFIETRHDGRSIFQAMFGIFQAVFIVYADDRYIAMIFCYDHRQSPFNGIKESFFKKLQIIHEGIF